jgi:uncharacterized metal-binding protein
LQLVDALCYLCGVRAAKRPDGYWHGRITIALTPIATAIGFALGLALGYPVYTGVLMGMGCLLGLFLDPDLDQEMITSSEWRFLRVGWPVIAIGSGVWGIASGIGAPATLLAVGIGGMAGPLWVAFWLPYAMVMKHRSTLSHFPGISTLIRVAYLLTPFIAIAIMFGVPVEPAWFAVAIPLFVGLVISDFGHYMRDYHGWRI